MEHDAAGVADDTRQRGQRQQAVEQKEHRKIEEISLTVQALMATVKEQASQIQKVNNQLKVAKPPPQVAVDNE